MSENYECSNEILSDSNREKKVTLRITPIIDKTEYIVPMLVTVVGIIVFCMVFYTSLWCFRKAYRPLTLESIDDQTSDVGSLAGTEVNSSMDETEYDTITEADFDKHEFFRKKGSLFVCDLARKDPRVLQNKSCLYVWQVSTVAIFYGLPAIQLVWTYQKTLADTGNLDLCYYNNWCAHPFGWLSDFNHVFSNVGYLMLGILFILLTRWRETLHCDRAFERCYGIPQHYGLFYAMGLALITEGALSACYHVCPNRSNFQFDSSFMYVTAVLIMVKLYQNRHPDVNARACVTFMVLAVVVFAALMGILENDIYFWIAFTVAHLIVCLLLTIQIYYLGCWRLDKKTIKAIRNNFRTSRFVDLLRPVHKARAILLLLGNICNWGLAIYGFMYHRVNNNNFPTYLLAILLANTCLYTLFYITMKLLHKERLRFHAWIFVLAGMVSWGLAVPLFFHRSVMWSVTPAHSRRFNQHCWIANFYDYHDIWHLLSAAALFFSFLLLLTLDDDLTHTHRSKIPVF